jgi:hypothetical protein
VSVDAARAVADAVLYEGYLLYPYRASAAKNRSRWQFGVLGPPAAAPDAFAEEPSLSLQCLLHPGVRPGAVTIRLRFLQLQRREVQDAAHRPVDRLTVAGETLLTWDEAVEHEITLPTVPLATGPADGGESPGHPVTIPGGTDVEDLGGTGRIVRRRHQLTARAGTTVEPDGDLLRLTVTVTNTHPRAVTGKDEAVGHSMLGTHLLVEAHDARFVSMQEPPPEAAAAAARCRQHRCWPVLAGSPHVLLGAPIILYDHPQVAPQSPGALFDATEIDEILTLRVMTMTDAEKAEARATDPRAAAIVDRCDGLTAADLQRLHGTRRGPGPQEGPGCGVAEPPPRPRPAATHSLDGDVPWWDPAADAAVDPETDAVLVGGVRVAKGSLVRVHPSRRADAQDLFFAGRVARVTAVVSDVDGGSHVAVVLVDDPAADLHDWYGRYFYFAPDEIEPLGEEPAC